MGKTALVVKSIEDREDAIYHQASHGTPVQQLDSFIADATTAFPGINRIRKDWENVLNYLAEQDAIVILDEFPYLVDENEALPSILYHEAHYDWISFVPVHYSDAGALTKYFGKVAGEDEYKYWCIECRQQSTPSYIDDAQKAVIRAVDAYRDPEAVCEELRTWVDRLRRGEVDLNELVTTIGSPKCCQRSRQSFP